MAEVRNPRRRSTRSSILRTAAVLAAAALLLGACGGGSVDTGSHTLHVMVVNATDADVTIGYTGAEPAEDQTQKTCSADTHDYPVSDPFVISINGETVIDSDVDLPDGIPNDGESDLIVRIDVAKDGTATFDKVRPGSGMQKPAKTAYCPGA
jgi:hypothetical protein